MDAKKVEQAIESVANDPEVKAMFDDAAREGWQRDHGDEQSVSPTSPIYYWPLYQYMFGPAGLTSVKLVGYNQIDISDIRPT